MSRPAVLLERSEPAKNMDDVPLYNSRILNTYIEYIRINHPDTNIEYALNYAGITIYEMEDEGHWFNQKQVDRFYEVLKRITGRDDLARECGRYVAQSQASSLIKQYALGFFQASTAYSLFGKIASNMTRGSTFKTKKLGPNKVELTSIPIPGCNEKPYQCENRMGACESLAMIFTKKLARIEHPVCFHKGGDSCVYTVSWEKTPSLLWRRIRNFSSIALVGMLPMSAVIPFGLWINLMLLMTTVFGAVTTYAEYLEKRELRTNIENHGAAAELLLEQINIRYSEMLVVKEIGQATSMILVIEKLLKFITESLGTKLDFDRGMIMLADKERKRLVYTVGYGYNDELEKFMKKVEFRLDNPYSKGVIVESFRKQTPFLINDMAEIEQTISQRSLEFARKIGAQSFICVPIVYEGEAMGVLLVDTIRSKRRLSHSDISLLMGIAPQIAISINNALSYQKIQESEQRFRSLSETAPDIIYTLDVRGALSYVNPAWEAILGYSEHESIGRYFIDFASSEDVSFFVKNFAQVRDKKETVRAIHGTLIHQDGSLRTFLMSGAPNLDADGKVIGIVGTLKDITDRIRAEKELKESFEKLQRAMESTIQAISTIVETRDPYTSGHQLRVASLACAIAKEMGIPEQEIEGIRMASVIHDIGKIYIPAEILSKPGELNRIEFDMIKTHAQVGYNILESIEFPYPVAMIVKQHHERIDGTGYPDRLAGNAIMKEAKILAVADVVEAMASHRPYRPSKGIDQALEEIARNRGRLYDEQVVDTCIGLFKSNKFKFEYTFH